MKENIVEKKNYTTLQHLWKRVVKIKEISPKRYLYLKPIRVFWDNFDRN